MKRLLIPLILIIFSLVPANGQPEDQIISGGFSDLPFMRFVEEVERQSRIRFYYREEWVSEVRIDATGENISLKHILDSALLQAGIQYYMDAHGQVFITGRSPISSILPDYTGRDQASTIPDGPDEQDEYFSAEQRYIEGRKAGLLETIQVGAEDESNGSTDAVVYGKMTAEETGEPLIGATVYFQELRKGAVTDADGNFSIVVKPGKYTVDFNCMGMETRHHYLEVFSGGYIPVAMKSSLIPLTEVVIHADRYDNVRGNQMGFERLDFRILKEVPVVMGEKDILKVVRMLPGVQSVGEGSSGFNVRGSPADQNMIYMNKVPVYNSSHLFGFFTSFSPDIVKDFTLYKSNLPAGYGGRIASFFDVSTRQGNMKEYTARGGISPVTGHVAVEGPILKDRAAFILSARSTYSDWVLRRLEDPDLRDSKAGFYDIAYGLTWDSGEKTRIKGFGYISRDRFTLGADNSYKYSNAGASLSIRHRFNPRITGDMAFVFGEYDFETIDLSIPSESYIHGYRIGHYEIRGDFTWLSLGKHRLEYGGNAILYDLNRGEVEPYGSLSLRSPIELGRENGIETALYVADNITLLPRLNLYAGVRYALYLSMGQEQVMIYEPGQPRRAGNVIDTLFFSRAHAGKVYSSLEPRLALNYLIGANNSVKLSYNRVRQFLFMLSNTIAISPTDQWKLCDYHINPPYADQVSLGYYHDIPAGDLSTSIEVYHKWISNAVDYRDGANFISSPHIETEVFQGNQKAYGFEAMIRKNTGKLNGWLAYSYARSFMHFPSAIPGESINGGNRYPSNYDRPHNLNLSTNYKMNRRLSFSANLVYVTGRPVTYPVSIYYVERLQYIDYSARNAYRIPDYFRMDLSINLEGNLKARKFLHSYWMLSFYNITGRQNVYSVFFKNDDGVINGYRLSVFGQPMVTLSWNFKLGNYASE